MSSDWLWTICKCGKGPYKSNGINGYHQPTKVGGDSNVKIAWYYVTKNLVKVVSMKWMGNK